MKKSLIFLTLILVIVTAVSLTACGNVPLQSVIESPWNDYKETSTYDVSYKEGEIEKGGEMIVTYQRFNGGKLNVKDDYIISHITPENITPDYTDDDFYGIIVTTDLKLDDGQNKYSIVVTDKQLKAKYSYAKSHFIDKNTDGEFEDLELEYKYDKTSVNYNVKGTIDKTGTIKYKEFNQVAYFDNAFYIALTRTLGPANSQRQLSFLTPSFRDDKMMKRVASTSPQRVEVKPHDELDVTRFTHSVDKEDQSTVTCYKHMIASGETMPGSGTPISYFIAAVPYNSLDGVKIEPMLVKFVEHDVTYLLKDIVMNKVM